jgi:hypothetical protein
MCQFRADCPPAPPFGTCSSSPTFVVSSPLGLGTLRAGLGDHVLVVCQGCFASSYDEGRSPLAVTGLSYHRDRAR